MHSIALYVGQINLYVIPILFNFFSRSWLSETETIQYKS